MNLPEEEELEPVPDWLDAQDLHVQFVLCPLYYLCGYSASYVEENDGEEEEVRKAYEDHWRDNH